MYLSNPDVPGTMFCHLTNQITGIAAITSFTQRVPAPPLNWGLSLLGTDMIDGNKQADESGVRRMNGQ